ncbi:PAS domain-containing protein [Pedobacter jamesrossensis]|uniref:PAS domain-containing protein n=1 Tax=Pedobacter jamesrossensis TaxID=1908238 RepID=A0ABV8NIJ8_9SPHI
MDIVSIDTLFDLEYFFDLSPDLLCIAGYDGYFKKINPAVSKTLGYSDQELFARPINSFVHPDDQEITSKNRQNITKGQPLINFENRYITKSGDIIWLSWTSMPIKRDKMVFAIAKVIYKKKLDEYWRILNALDSDDQKRKSFYANQAGKEPLSTDQIWLDQLEVTIKKYIGKIELTNNLLSSELIMSERQLFRRVKSILGITPNKFVQIIRFKLASEAIATGRYSTLAEISNIAGFDTPAYFNKLFKEVHGINVLEALHKESQAASTLGNFPPPKIFREE